MGKASERNGATALDAREPLRVLLLEDDDDDARLIETALGSLATPFTTTRTTTRDEFLDQSTGNGFDVALLVNDVPGLDGRAALEMLRRSTPQVPAIIVSSSLGDVAAVALLKLGARDYVLKDHLGVLSNAVERAVAMEAGIRERKGREREAARSEQRYRRLFESAKDGILILEAESGRITDANPYICTLLEQARGALVGKQLWEIGVVADIAASQRMFDDLQVSGFVRYDDLPLRSASTAVHEVEFVSNQYMEGEVAVIQCNIRDISAQRLLERTRFESERRMRSMLDNVGLVAVHTDLDGRVTYVNDFFLDLTGHRRDAVVGMDWLEFVPSDARAETQATLAEVVAGPDRAGHHDNEILTTSGERRLIRWSSTVLLDSDGIAIGAAAIGEDRTEQRITARSLVEAQGRFEALVQNTADVIAVIDVDGQVQFVSQAVRALGYEPSEVVGTPFVQWIHPDDLAIAAAAFTETLTAPLARTHVESRLHRKDGTVAWMDVVAVNGVTVPGINGIAVFLRDMTTEKTARQELFSSQQILAGIVDSLPLRVFWKDTDLVYRGCNTTFAKDAGRTDPSEVVGRTDHDMGWGDQEAALYQAGDREVMQTGRAKLLIEGPQTTPDGETISLLTSKVPLRDATGAITGVLGAYWDITVIAQQRETIERSLDATVAALAGTVEVRDPYTAGHQRRVADLAATIARAMGMPEEQIRGLAIAATIHDLGKISIPSEILSKPGRLSAAEFGLVKGHAEAGYQMIKDIEFPWPVADIVRQHHERLDGSGYPQGLTADQILPEAKILAVADMVEAISTHRPYRPSLGPQVALDIILAERGTALDAAAVDACTSLFESENYTFPTP